jgi:hypothetical protein
MDSNAVLIVLLIGLDRSSNVSGILDLTEMGRISFYKNRNGDHTAREGGGLLTVLEHMRELVRNRLERPIRCVIETDPESRYAPKVIAVRPLKWHFHEPSPCRVGQK